MTDDDTVRLTPQQVVLRNALADLLDDQLGTYSVERLGTITTAAHALVTGREIDQRAFGVHVVAQLLLHVQREIQARRAALAQPSPPLPLH